MKQSKAKLRERYDELEDNNDHNACAILLVKAFGTKQELQALEHIKSEHEKRGHILQEEVDVRRNISQKYYKLLFI